MPKLTMPKIVNDGGPAFPTMNEGGRGMSLRDYFAAMAMQAYLSIWDPEEVYDDHDAVAKALQESNA